MQKYFWTEDEDLFIRENYAKLGPKGCAEAMHRTYASVCVRGRQLDLNKYKRVGWTAEMDNFIVENYGTHSADWIADKLNVPITATEKRIEKIGAKKAWGFRCCNADGYVYIGRSRGKNPPRKAEHRIVAEKMIGRKLTSNDIVHHINRNVADNRPENLMVMTRAEHAALHNREDKLLRKI